MSLGLSPCQQDMFATTASFCEPLVAPDSIYALLHRECHRLFPDEMFADLFCDVGRRCVPPMIVAVVMVLQRRPQARRQYGGVTVRRPSECFATRRGRLARA